MPDRTYWRAQSNMRLIDEARYSGHELCIALGERLEDLQADGDERISEAVERAIDAERDASKLDDEVYEMGVQIDTLEMQLTQREDEVAHLRAEIKHLKETAK